MMTSLALGKYDETAEVEIRFPPRPRVHFALVRHLSQCVRAQSCTRHPEARMGCRRQCAGKSCRACTTSSRLIKQDLQTHEERTAGAIIPFCGKVQLWAYVQKLPFSMQAITVIQ